jgi:hypothetical protein
MNAQIQSTLAVICIITFTSLEAQQASDFETPPVLRAADVLPPALIKGDHFTVQDQVRWKEGLHVFQVDSEFGSFEIWGEPMLRVRLREVEALHTLKNTSSASVGTAAATKALGSSLVSVGTAFRHPVATTKALPGGLKRMFKSIKYDVQSISATGKAVAEENAQGGPAPGDNSKAKNAGIKLGRSFIGVTSAYRKWAENVGVNPYTTNVALHAELERVAKVDAGSKMGTKIFMPSLIPEEFQIIKDVSKTAYHKEWREVIEDNQIALDAMGIEPDMKDRFLNNDHINLTLQTLLIELLESMTEVEDRAIVIAQASLLVTDAEAAFFAESVIMAQWFHTNMSPAAKMLGGTLIPVILTRDGRVIAFSASDFEYWTKDVAPIAAEFDRQYRTISNKREVWIADSVSSGYVRGVSNLGWSVRSDLRSKVLPQIPWGLQDGG